MLSGGEATRRAESELRGISIDHVPCAALVADAIADVGEGEGRGRAGGRRWQERLGGKREMEKRQRTRPPEDTVVRDCYFVA